MEQTPYHLFIAFVRFDNNLDAQKKRLIALTHEISHLEEQKNRLSHQLETSVQAIRDLKKQVDSYELELKDLRSKEASKKMQLANVSSPREYFSLEQELVTIQTKYKTIDEQLFDVWNRYETTQPQLELEKEKIIAEKKNLGLEQEEKQHELAQLQSHVAELEQERINKLDQLPQEWKTQYLAMKERVENPVVPVLQGNCTGCFYPVPSPDLLAIKRHKLVMCKECYRLLYSDDV